MPVGFSADEIKIPKGQPVRVPVKRTGNNSTRCSLNVLFRGHTLYSPSASEYSRFVELVWEAGKTGELYAEIPSSHSANPVEYVEAYLRSDNIVGDTLDSTQGALSCAIAIHELGIEPQFIPPDAKTRVLGEKVLVPGGEPISEQYSFEELAHEISPYLQEEDAIRQIIIGNGTRRSWEIQHDKGDQPKVEFFSQTGQISLHWQPLNATALLVQPILTLAKEVAVVVKISK